MPTAWQNLEWQPALLRGTAKEPIFSVNGSGHELLKGNDIPVTYTWKVERTEIVVPQTQNPLWTYHSLALIPGSGYGYPTIALSKFIISFHADLLLSTAAEASADIPLVNAGLLNSAGECLESFQGVFPASELAKLTDQTWYLAKVTGYESNALYGVYPFFCVGGL
jgi:hypothetical protein